MSFLDDVRAKRQKLADVLSDKDYSGIREIVEQLYPDRAHFIYELLQNAEDAGATEASFTLGDNSLRFEHNGRPFSEGDVWGITNIGKGTKKEQEDKIGRFGVGFKAVFAYSETPHIWSPTFSFKISELVLPAAITAKPALGQITRFEFPFNNPKKIAPDAHAEVEGGLNDLAETTLLFLSNLKSIQWQIAQRGSGKVLRIQHSENHIEVLKQAGGKRPASSHFLRFSRSVLGLEKQRVSVAFALDYLPTIAAFDPETALSKQLKIVPANPGRVAVFFPAEKETSGLRFHLNAPFVPELSRASIKETPANEPLFKQLAEVAAESLHTVRELNLLTGEFLAVLPNPQDILPARYQRIRQAIIAEMNNQPLTPTHSKSYAPAKYLLQAKASLKDLLSPEDIEFLIDYDDEPPQWAIAASQKNSNADRFLSGLDITEWDISELVERLEQKATVRASQDEPNEDFVKWLTAKPIEWHQQAYSLFYKELSPDDEIYRLKDLQIVRLSDGSYSLGSKCYFPSDGVERDEIFPRVAKGVYSSGKSKTQQEEAQKLLEELGVREVGEADQVQEILSQRYQAESFRPDMKDLERFIALLEKDPQKSKLFASYYIFQRADRKWGKPSQVFLDSPYFETGLSACYQALGNDAPRAPLAQGYEQCGIPVEKLIKFAEAVGVQTRLEVVETSCHKNPEWPYLRSVGGERYRSPINQDFVIPELERLLSQPSVELSKLVWRTMCSLPGRPNQLRARYQKNEAKGCREAASQLVHVLRKSVWVPQTDGAFVRPSEASRELLPKGFPFDKGYEWLKAVHFGVMNQQRIEENQKREITAKQLGFPDAGSLERAKQFVALPQAEQERFLAECQRRHQPELPEQEPANPERRSQRVEQQAADAPARITEHRMRSVSVGREDVKQLAEPYLRDQYTNPDGEMICQLCKASLPFKLDDGSFYFEKVEFLADLKKRHYQNYLALCPNHAAMFQHVNSSEKLMRDRFVELETNELDVVLAQKDMTIYFTKTHMADLKSVIEAEQTTEPGIGNERVSSFI